MLIRIQPDATVWRYLFTAKSLYMFRVSKHPSSRVLKTVTAASGTGHNTGTATSLQRGLIDPTRCNSMQIFIYCKVTVHVSGVTTPIIRSTKNCNRSHRYSYFPPTWPDRSNQIQQYADIYSLQCLSTCFGCHSTHHQEY